MVVQNDTLIAKCKQMFSRRKEQVLTTTFWANDWKRGQEYVIDGRTFRVTRYVRSTNARFFDVMGYEIQPATALVASGVVA